MSLNRRRFLQAAGVSAGASLVSAGLGISSTARAFHDEFQRTGLIQPTYGDIENLRVLGYSDLAYQGVSGHALDPKTNLPWDRVAEFRVKDGYAICSNYQGWSIVDVRDPHNMQVVFRYQNDPAPDNTQYIDITSDDIVVQKTNFSLKLWDARNKTAPTFLSSWTPPDLQTTGAPFHGLWVHEDRRGKFAFAAANIQGFTDQILVIVNITDPLKPFEEARWWYPGMWLAGGETPTWPTNVPGLRVQCHDMTTYRNRCYAAWRDKGVIILDISNISRPTRIGEFSWADPERNYAALPGETHSVGIVVPERGERVETIVVPDELSQCPYGFMHVVDVRNESRPIEISGFRTPLNLHANCPPDRPGRRFGTHDPERMIRGDLVWSAWEEAGFWGFTIKDIHYPKHVAHFIPPVRSDSPAASRSGHADDVFVTRDGTIFGSSSDPGAGGLWAMRYTPGLKGKIVWNSAENGVLFMRTRDDSHR